MRQTTHNERFRNCAGFTLTEVVVAASISVLVGASVMTAFIWCMNEASTCAKIAWSQKEAMQSAAKLTAYIRNASAISRFDTSKGKWIEFRFTNGLVSRITYTNSPAMLRDGSLYLQRSNFIDRIVVRGVTAIPREDGSGFTEWIFSPVGSNAVRLAYRVSEPASGNTNSAADDAAFAASVRFTVTLRNYSTTSP